MTRTLAFAAALLLALPAAAQLRASIEFVLPVPVPRLVVVEPGVQVVAEVDEEIFFSGGWYWLRRDGGWYRARDCRHARWAFVEPRRVPRAVYHVPPGRYRRLHEADWKAAKAREKAERRAAKEHEKQERRAAKEHRKEHGNGHGHGRGEGRGHRR